MEDVIYVGSENCIYDTMNKCYKINKNNFKYDEEKDKYYVVLDSSNINRKWKYTIVIMYNNEKPIINYENRIITETKIIVYLEKAIDIELYINFGDNALNNTDIYLNINDFIKVDSNKEIVKLIESIESFNDENLYLLKMILTRLSNKYPKDRKINLNELSEDIKEYYEDYKLLGL